MHESNSCSVPDVLRKLSEVGWEVCTNVVYEPTSKPLSESVWVAVDNRLTNRV